MTPRPTSVRYSMIAATTLVAVMLYLDRVCLSIVGEQISKDLKLTDDQFAELLSSFFWAYALFQLPAGWLGDRYGPRRVLAAYLLLWSACTGLMGLANGFAALLALRLGCGAFEAGAYPLAASVVRRWAPAVVRGTASSLVAVGGRVGGAIAPVLTAGLAAGAADGWRRPFVLYGVVGALGALVFFLWYRDRPDRHPAVNEAEVDLITGGVPPAPEAPVGPPPVGAFILSRAVWMCSLVQFLANFAWVFIITLFPKYLERVFATPTEDRAFYQSLPLYAGIVGMLMGGVVTDFAVRRLGLRWGRAVPMACARLVVGATFFACLSVGDAVTITLLMCVVAWATDIGTAPTWAWGQDVGGRHVGATIGWANMWGNFGAAASPLVFQWLLRQSPDDPVAAWRTGFALCAGLQLVAAVAALGIDAARPIVAASRAR